MPLLIFSSGCVRAGTEKDFWDCFRKNEARLFDFQKDQDRIFSELTIQLDKIDPHLTFEFSSIENGPREFTISADRIRAAFPKVEDLHAAAPALPRWKINKFRQRNEPTNLSVNGVKVDESTVLVTVKPQGSKADIIVFLPDYSKTNRDTNLTIAFLILDQSLGEYDVETRSGAIDVKPASEAPPSAFPFRELFKRFDALFLPEN